jgi:RNA polymerase sigma factor (sigma-70 family)
VNPSNSATQSRSARTERDHRTAGLLNEASRTVGPLAAHLPDGERQIIQLRLAEQLTQQEIGERLDISEMQISRTLSAFCLRLRLRLRAALLETTLSSASVA